MMIPTLKPAGGDAMPVVGLGLRKIEKPAAPAIVQRAIENLALFDFAPSDDEMRAISALDRNRRFNDPGGFCDAAFHTVFPIYE